MIDLYYWTTPNGHKITIFLEESNLPYKIVPVNISKGEQFRPEFLALSPNNRIPAIIDHRPTDDDAPIWVFESGAILVYLAEKTERFLPSGFRQRVVVLEWLFWQMAGLGPMAGQNHHFSQYAPQKIAYAIDRLCERDKQALWRSRPSPVTGWGDAVSFYRGRVFNRRHGHLSMDRPLRTAGTEPR
jgi:GST-like protein